MAPIAASATRTSSNAVPLAMSASIPNPTPTTPAATSPASSAPTLRSRCVGRSTNTVFFPCSSATPYKETAMRPRFALFATLAVATTAWAQTPRPDSSAPPVLIKAGRLIDGRSDAPQSGVGILIEGDRIKAVGPLAQVQGQAKGARVIDLSQMTVLPGLIDTHTHLLLQGDPTAGSYNDQLLYQSTPYRAILAARNARIALEHGFTTIRDLETEGAMYADVDVKRAVDRGEIPGPRIFASTRAMQPTGMYPIVSDNWRLDRFPARRPRCDGRVLGAGGDGGLIRRRAAQRRVGTDGGAPTPGVHPGAQEGRPDRVRNGCLRISLDRAQSGERVRVLCAVWHDPDAGDQVGNVARGGAAGPTGSGCRRPWRLCGPGRGGGGPVEGCDGTVARAIRYEGRGHLSFAIVRRALETSLALLFGAVGPVVGQFTPPGTGGVAGLAGARKQLGANHRILVIGAHPDDEYSDLVALFARGMGAQVAYLSLSRGEGGQNLIGPELGPELGVIRSEELLAARRIDGARQFFTRAYDFGYSKTLEEALRFWPRDSVLKDVLDVVRRFRPQIIVSVFSGTPRDGHGQHQVAGLLARQAFEALRDSSWGPVKLYRSLYVDTASATLRLDAGWLDPVEGRSYHQIAMAGRSRHRSQDEGQLEQPGPRIGRLAFVEWRERGRETRDGDGLFAGVDTLFPGKVRYAGLIDSARVQLNPTRPDVIAPLLGRALRELGAADSGQQAILEEALAAAAGVAIDGFADDGIVIPGERVQVETSVWNAGDAGVTLDGMELGAPAGWKVERLDPVSAPVPTGTLVTRRFAVTVATDAPRSQAYFLRRPLVGALYDWSGVPAAWRGLPFQPPPVPMTVRLPVT